MQSLITIRKKRHKGTFVRLEFYIFGCKVVFIDINEVGLHIHHHDAGRSACYGARQPAPGYTIGAGLR